MPEILIAVVAAAGVYKGYKWFSQKVKTAQNIAGKAASAAAKAKVKMKNMPKLIRDPISGVYRVKK